MNIQYIRKNELPSLAWIAHVKGCTTIVTCGNSVELQDNSFVEGAWSGNFSEMDFCSDCWFCGTGGCADEDSITFATPSHVTYGLHSYRCETGEYYVSNSLYLLLTQLGYCLDPNYIHYEVDFNTILDGINKYKRDIHVLDNQGKDAVVNVDYFKLIRISNEGILQISNRPESKPFTSFEDYYERLLKAMTLMTQNAADVARKRQYGIVTTISKGYDAPCCAAIAKKCGCDVAITFKAEGRYKEDCGTEIAKALGYTKIYEVDANEYLQNNKLIEVEYICSGELGASISFSSFDRYVVGNLCLTGERGDRIWNRNAADKNDEFAFEDMVSHIGSCERRLWLDYISVPMPLFGASFWTSIHKISNSDAMKPWRMDNSYDRPIPRRIVEESGVNRECFGVKKNGAGFVYKFDWFDRILSRMSVTTADSFRKYVSEHRKLRIGETVRFLWDLRCIYAKRVGLPVKAPSPKDCSKIANPMATALLIPWAGEIMLQRYRTILGRE